MFFITNGNPYLLGFTVGIIFLVLGPISGGLSNPALSLAIAQFGKLSLRDLMLQIAVQVLAAGLGVVAFNFVEE